jgi:hypothetical protein
MPITLSARAGIVPPIFEIEIEEVFEARIAWSGATLATF